MENISQGLTNFDEMSRELLSNFNPDSAKQQSKEMIANLLLMMGVPFFLERLKDKLPADILTKLTEFTKDPQSFGKNSLKLAQELFNEKIVQPLKGELLGEMDKYIPALKNLSDIDLSKLSVKDVQDLFQKQLIQKLRNNLPPEIADRLPENFTQEDILNSLKNLSKDQALKFAKDNLPPEAYNMLEQNEQILTDPARLSEFMKGKFDEASSKISDTVSEFKNQAYSRLNEIKNSIKDEIDKNVQPFKDKINELKQTKQNLQDQLQAGKDDIQSRYNDVADRLRQLKADNPDYTAQDIQPFRDARDALKTEAENLKTKSLQDLNDVDSQITDNTSTIDDITNNLVQKAYNLKNTITSGIQNFTEKGKEALQQGIQKGQEFRQQGEATINDVTQQAQELEGELRNTATKAISTVKTQAKSFTPQEPEVEEPSEGVFSRISSFMGFKKTPTQSILDRTQPTIQMSSPDELESSYSERALDTSNNRMLLRYRATELGDVTLDETGPRISGYRPAPRQSFRERRTMREQQAREDARQQARQQVEPETQPEIQPQGESVVSVEPNVRPSQVIREAPEFSTPQQQLPRAQIASEIEPAPVQPTTTTAQPTTAPTPTEPQLASGEAPSATTLQSGQLGETSTQNLGEGESALNKLASNLMKAPSKAPTPASGEVEAGVEALDETAVATEEIPVLDVVMDVAGLFGTIFGAKSLMGESTPKQPLAEGTSYEPDL